MLFTFTFQLVKKIIIEIKISNIALLLQKAHQIFLMIIIRLLAAVLLTGLSFDSFAQSPLPVPVNIQTLYQKGTRSEDGKPGLDYWQNTATYNIHADFDPATLLLKGSEKIAYTNNSPDTLYSIVFKLYPNLYKKGAERLASVEPEDIGDGMMIDKINVIKSPVLTYSLDGTNMTVTIPPLLPKDSIIFNIDFHYTLNKRSHIRTG